MWQSDGKTNQRISTGDTGNTGYGYGSSRVALVNGDVMRRLFETGCVRLELAGKKTLSIAAVSFNPVFPVFPVEIFHFRSESSS
jgi:hypothetical protein